MRVVTAAVIVAFLCGPAFAQAPQHMPQAGEPDKDLTPGQKETAREAERAYRRSLGNIPEQKPNDPWGTVRGDNKPADKSADKPAAPKKARTSTTKTGTGTAKTGTSSN
jgi:hypothetical protein